MYLRGWLNISTEVWIWTYMGNIAWPLAPFPNYRQVADDIGFMASAGVQGVFCQSAGQPASDMTELKAYVVGRKSFDPTLNTSLLVKEFVDGFYSVEAAPFVLEYLDVLENAAVSYMGLGIGGGGLVPSSALFTNETTLAAATALHRATTAVTAASQPGQARYQERTRRAALPIQYILLLRWREYRQFCNVTNCKWPGPTTQRGTFTEFAQEVQRAGVTLVATPSCANWRVTDCWKRD
eukprot:COSAG01_NODE_21840_length_882_cov_2.372925_1_plen_237_part_10